MLQKPEIIIDCEKLKNKYSGLGQFCHYLATSLIEENGPRYTFYVPKKEKNIFGNQCKYIVQKPWHKLTGIAAPASAIWHITHQTSKYKPSNAKTKTLLTIHDLNFLYKYTGAKKEQKIKQLQKMVNRATALTTISQFTAQELQAHVNIGAKPLHVIHNGNTTNTTISPQKPTWANEQEPFLFCIGVISERKNAGVLIPFLQKIKDYKLILAGENTTAYAATITALAEKHGVKNKFIMPGNVTEAEKLWLYKNCSALVFPSLAEGFGLPVIEAMSEGKPVFLNRATSLPEIGGNNAFYWQNFDPDEMKNVFETGMHRFSDMQLANAYKQHAAQFTWQRAAKAYQQVYNSL